ncbi:MAG: hypothetical protein M0C28_16305 [Candidatus Moduliflexus flocculans]|nr:hypothetical protein [Candidatus Moduliflexus flocculans]
MYASVLQHRSTHMGWDGRALVLNAARYMVPGARRACCCSAPRAPWCCRPA